MKPYKDLNGSSGIISYDCGSDWIEVQFEASRYKFYRYTHDSNGASHVEEMKRLAKLGSGLNTYINENVKGFASRR